MMRTTRPTLALLFLAMLFLTGCATTHSNTTASSDNSEAYTADKDPLENLNRSILKFNLAADRYVIKPIARTYVEILPQPIRNGVNNFFSNLWEPMTVVNDLLQGKFRKAGRDTSRFVINTTLGFLGLNDVATHFNLPKQREDFGQTLAVWGVPSGPYLVLPLLGPSNLRDTVGLIPQRVYGDAVSYADSPERTYANVVRIVDGRSRLLGTDDLLDLQPDKYLFLREGYRQRRLNQIYDGNPPVDKNRESSEEELLDQLLEEDS